MKYQIDDLKPCPFCGSSNVGFSSMRSLFNVPYCSHCGATIDTCSDTQQAIYRWNTRSHAVPVNEEQPTADEGLVEELEAYCKMVRKALTADIHESHISQIENILSRHAAKPSAPDGQVKATEEPCKMKGGPEGCVTCSDKCPESQALPVESLAVLADVNGFYAVHIQPPTDTVKTWDIELFSKIEGDAMESEKYFEAPTYSECEAKARQFLEGLDKGETK